jgi:hypothetical protein
MLTFDILLFATLISEPAGTGRLPAGFKILSQKLFYFRSYSYEKPRPIIPLFVLSGKGPREQ